MAYNTKLYRSNGVAFEELRVGSDWSLIANKPATFTPTSHNHNNYVALTGNQELTGIKQINTSDLRMNGGSVSYLRPVTTGGWARGFWWQKNATDDVPYERIGGIGVLGSNLSVSKFYIGYGNSPWTNSILEAYPSYVKINGGLSLTGDITVNGTAVSLSSHTHSSYLTGITKSMVVGTGITASDIGALGAMAKAKDSEKLDGQLASYYARASSLNDFVTLGTEQTISGKKTFQGIVSFINLPKWGNENLEVQGHTHAYLGINSQAADSNKLDGQLASYYAKANYNVKTQTVDFTLNTTFVSGDLIICNKTSTQTITIPNDTSYNHPIGTRIDFIRSNFDVYFVAGTGVTLSSDGGKYYINASGQAATLIKDAANHWLLIGALKS